MLKYVDTCHPYICCRQNQSGLIRVTHLPKSCTVDYLFCAKLPEYFPKFKSIISKIKVGNDYISQCVL